MTSRALPTLLFVVAMVPLLPACGDAPSPADVVPEGPPRPAKIVTVAPTGETATHTFPGTIEASREAELAFRVEGELVALPASPGMRVEQGEVLARLDEADFRNELADREAKYDLALTQHEQAKKLFRQNYTTQASLDEAAANLKAAKAARELARDNLGYATLRAPFAGIIGSVAVENHQAVKAQTAVLRLQDDTCSDVVFYIPESLMTQLPRVEHPETLCGTVRFYSRPDLGYRACYKEHDSVPDALTRTYRVVYTMPRVEEFPALPGMAVNIELDLADLLATAPQGVLSVPVEAVFDAEGKHWVWRVNAAQEVERVEVRTGAIRGAELAVLAGLNPGDRIVAAGVSHLRAGQKVTPFVKERGL